MFLWLSISARMSSRCSHFEVILISRVLVSTQVWYCHIPGGGRKVVFPVTWQKKFGGHLEILLNYLFVYFWNVIFFVLKQLRVGFYQTFKRLRINTANIHDIFKCECFQHYDFGLTGNIGFSILFYRFEIHLHLWDKGYRVFQTWPIGLQET